MPDSARSAARGFGLLGVLGILLIAVNLRVAVGGLSPLAEQISVDVPLSASALGLLGIAAPLGFALAGLVAPALSHAWGLERTLMLAVVAMIAGHLVRAAATDVATLLAGSLIVLLGAGFGNILLPSAVKKYAPGRIGAVTALYGTAMAIGSSLPPLIVVPLAAALDWRVALGAWSLAALAALAPWVWLALRARRVRHAERAAVADGAAPRALDPTLPLRRLARSRTVWGITIAFGVSSICAYAVFALLPSILRETAGLDPAAAGALLALFGILGLPLALGVPVLSSRLKHPTWLLIAAAGLWTLGYGGLIVAPAAAPVVWVAAIGLAQIGFPLGLTLIGLRTASPRTAAAVSGFVQTVSYLAAVISPLALGALREATGGWTASLAALVAISLVTLLAIPLLRGDSTVEDELARR